MLTFDQIIEKRRSIRRYLDEAPPREIIDRMLASARLAPSPSHSQPVRYVLIESEAMRTALGERMIQGRDRLLAENEALGAPKKIRNLIRAYFRFSEFMFSAPFLFALGTQTVTTLESRLRDAGLTVAHLKQTRDLDLSTGLSLSAFLLKGAELGIATCVLTAPLIYMGPVSDLLGKDLRINCFVTAGFADEQPRPLQRITVEELCRCL